MFSRFSFSSQDRSYDKSALWIFLALFILAAVVVIPNTIFPIFSTKITILALGSIAALVLYVLARYSVGNISLPPLLLIGALWSVPLAYGLSTVFSGAPLAISVFGHSFEADTFGFLFLMGLVGTLAAFIIEMPVHYRHFLRISAILAMFIFVVQALFIIVHYIYPNAISPLLSVLGSWSDLTLFSGLVAVMVMLAFRFIPLTRRAKWYFGVLLAFSLLYMIIAYSIATWVLVSITALGLFVESVMRRVTPFSQRADTFIEVETEDGVAVADVETHEMVWDTDAPSYSIVAPLVVLVVSLFFILGGAAISGTVKNTLHINFLNVRPSWQSTMRIEHASYGTTALFGSGPDTFTKQWLLLRNKSINATPFWNTNFTGGIGFIPTSFITTGIVGTIAWLFLLVALITVGIRSFIVKEYENTSLRTVSLIAFLGSLFVFLELIFTVPGPISIAFGFLLLGIFISTLRYRKNSNTRVISFMESPRASFSVIFILTLFLLVFLAGAYMVVGRYTAQVYLTQSQKNLYAGNISAADSSALNSLRFAKSDDAYRTRAVIAATAVRQLERTATSTSPAFQKQIQNILSQGIANAQAAIRINADSYINWLALGNLYQIAIPLKVSGSYVAAQSAYFKAASLNPVSPLILYTQAQAAVENRSYADANSFLKKAIALKQNYTQAIFLLSQVDVQLGKAKEALTAAQSAAYFSPNNPYVLFQVGVLREATGDMSGAIPVLKRAITINPKYANAHYFLAVAYANKKDYKKAITELKAIVKLSSGNERTIAPIIGALEKGVNPFHKSSAKNLSSGTPIKTSSGK